MKSYEKFSHNIGIGDPLDVRHIVQLLWPVIRQELCLNMPFNNGFVAVWKSSNEAHHINQNKS